MATLYVDKDHPSASDATSRASNTASAPWATLGRAVWGSATKSAPDTGECARPGDTVIIVGGASLGSPVVYTHSDLGANSPLAPFYLPAVTGTNHTTGLITFQAQGYVQIGAPAANSPALGTTASIQYVKWYADRADSRFIIECDGRFGPAKSIASSEVTVGDDLIIHTSTAHGYVTGDEVFVRNHNSTPAFGAANTGTDIVRTITVIDSDSFSITGTWTAGGGATGTVREKWDVKADTSVVNPTPDSGPIFLGGFGGWIEGFDIDGGPMIDYVDNWEGFRVQNANEFTIRNNYIHDFRRDHNEDGVDNSNRNQSGITMYGAQNGLIEHNLIENCGAGIFWKDTLAHNPHDSNTVRYNRILSPVVTAITGATEGITYSVSGPTVGEHAKSLVYQNLITDVTVGIQIISGATEDGDDIAYNTFARVQFGTRGGGNDVATGYRIWNNIFSVTSQVIEYSQGSVPYPTDAEIDLEHNVYFGFTASTFMVDNSGNHAFGPDGTPGTWLNDYPSQDHASPASVNSDPLFVDEDADDFRIEAGSPARNLAATIGSLSFSHAGAYQTGFEQIGLESEDAPAAGYGGHPALLLAVL